MNTGKKINLDPSRLYGFKILTAGRKSALSSKVGDKVLNRPLVLASKIGGKAGTKVF